MFVGIAVCSKSLSHLGDVSMRFIEWIELLRNQGVDKIFLKVYAVHPNVMKVIRTRRARTEKLTR